MKRQLLPECFTADDAMQVLGAASQDSMGPVIRVLLWNILKARRTNWSTDFKQLSADRDLVLLQEAVLNAPTDTLFSQHKRFEWVMARSFRHPRTAVEHGVKTGAVTTYIDKQFYLSPHSEPLLQTQKLLLTTRYPLCDTSATLLVLNMHAINFVSIHKYTEQLDQLQVALAGHSGPVILGGDFNTWNPARLGRFFEVAQQADLSEAAMERRSKLAHMNQHLDHLFYRGLTLQSVESISSYRSSDHAPIVASFST